MNSKDAAPPSECAPFPSTADSLVGSTQLGTGVRLITSLRTVTVTGYTGECCLSVRLTFVRWHNKRDSCVLVAAYGCGTWDLAVYRVVGALLRLACRSIPISCLFVCFVVILCYLVRTSEFLKGWRWNLILGFLLKIFVSFQFWLK